MGVLLAGARAFLLHHHNHLQAQIKENDFGIAVLRDLLLRFAQFVHHLLDITIMDKWGEPS